MIGLSCCSLHEVYPFSRTILILYGASCNKVRDFGLHMSIKTLLRSIVPAVSLPGHGLDKLRVFQLVDESMAGVMTSLITMNNRLVIQSAAIYRNQLVNGLDDEIYLSETLSSYARTSRTASICPICLVVGNEEVPRRLSKFTNCTAIAGISQGVCSSSLMTIYTAHLRNLKYFCISQVLL